MTHKQTVIAIKQSKPYSFVRRIYHALRDWEHTKDNLKAWSDIRRFKNIAHGGPCVVIGNGPSLRIEDLSRLHELGIPTFACNRVFLAFEQTDWRPNCYLISDERLIKTYNGEMDSFHSTICFFPKRYRSQVKQGHFYNELEFDYIKEGQFSLDAAKGVCPGGSVTTEMLQLAYYMGYSEIYLIGVDFNYQITAQNSDKTYAYQGENNYFIKGYLKQGEIAATPNVAANLLAFQAARSAVEAQGRIIRNATRGGKLEVFERADLDELFKKWELERR